MIKSIKVRLKPNNKQLTKLFQYAGCARFAYNWAIAREQENYKQGNKFLSDYDLIKEFTQLKKVSEYEWLNGLSSNVARQAIIDAYNAYKRFLRGKVTIQSLRVRNILNNLFIKITSRFSLQILMLRLKNSQKVKNQINKN